MLLDMSDIKIKGTYERNVYIKFGKPILYNTGDMHWIMFCIKVGQRSKYNKEGHSDLLSVYDSSSLNRYTPKVYRPYRITDMHQTSFSYKVGKR